MHQRWAFGKQNPVRESVGMRVKRLLTRPLNVMLVVLGFVLVFSAAQMHAYSPFPVSVSTSQLELQQGSELPVQIGVETPYGKNALVSFDVEYLPNTLSVDGELNSISTSFPLQREMRVKALSGAAPGTYFVTLHVHTNVEGQSFTESKIIAVKVVPKSQITYFTSPYTTASPHVSSVVFSAEKLVLKRTEKDSFSVSFVNQGSATDYLVRLSENPIGISVHTTNDIHRFVEPNESVTTFFEVSSFAYSPFGIIPLRIEAYDLVSGEKTFLGTVLVDVKEFSNLEVSVPFHEFLVEENNSIYSYITLHNTEYNDVDVILESSSTLVQVQSPQVHVPSKSSVSVPVLIRAAPSLGSRSETIYVMNAQLTEQFSFIVSTMEKGSLNVPIQDDNTSMEGTPGTGLVTGSASQLVGLLLVLAAVLLVVSSRFRGWVQSKLPKPKTYEIHEKKPMDLEKIPSSKK